MGLMISSSTPIGAATGDGSYLPGWWTFAVNANDTGDAPFNNGSLQGDANLTSTDGTSLVLDGTGDYVTVANDDSLNLTDEVTVEARVKFSEIKECAIVSKGIDGQENYELEIDSHGQVEYAMVTSSGRAYGYSNLNVSEGVWYHIALTYKSGEISMYIDGAQMYHWEHVTGSLVTNEQPLLIGAETMGSTPGRFLNGYIDEVRIWNKALTADQIGYYTSPAVSITSPANGATYCYGLNVPSPEYIAQGQIFSGIAESGYSTELGTHTYNVNVWDYWNNDETPSASASSTYTVVVGYDVTYHGNWGDPEETYEDTEGAQPAGGDYTIGDCDFGSPSYQTFSEWNTQADGNGISYLPGDQISMPSNDLSLYAIWGPLLVDFDSQGGSPVATEYIDPETHKVAQPGDPAKEGYIFGGWYADAICPDELLWDFNLCTVEYNMTLFAKWTIDWDYYTDFYGLGVYEQYSNILSEADYIGDDGARSLAQTFTTSSSHTVDIMALRLFLPDWDESELYTGTITASIRATDTNGLPVGDDLCWGTLDAADITANPCWNSWNMIPMNSSYSLVSGTQYALVLQATADPGHFVSWLASQEDAYANGAALTASNEGWYVEDWDGSEGDFMFGILGDPLYTISFNSEGGSTVPNQAVIPGGQATQPFDPTRTGYAFDKWYTDSACTIGNEYDFSTLVNADITLYAKWKQAPAFISLNSATFTVDSSGSFTIITSGDPTPSLSITSGTLPSGVDFTDNHDGTATLSGTPAAGAGGLCNLTFNASNGVDLDATQAFTLTINEAVSITTQPKNWAAVAGKSTSVSVAINGSSYPAPAFQWQVNTGKKWSNISGAINATYTITNVTSQMSGYQYRVIITQGSNVVTSNIAKLTVFKSAVNTADLSITQQNPAVYSGGNITWTITVKNNGPDTAQGVKVSDTLAAGTKFLSINLSDIPGATYKVGGNTITVNIGTLASGASCTFTITAQVVRAKSPVSNTATVNATSYDNDSGNNSFTAACTWYLVQLENYWPVKNV
jgi:uncharacterized repeat protein (TIGR01451 family)/uncharacterized repeat protein (TIGR02543 family)